MIGMDGCLAPIRTICYCNSWHYNFSKSSSVSIAQLFRMLGFVFCIFSIFTLILAITMLNVMLFTFLGPNLIAKYQEKYGANVFCNTMVPIDKLIVKYNVITTKQLITDLLDWETLYLSGRLHKPVVEIVPPETTELESALKINRKSAMHAALLLLPETFSLSELYRTIAQLSYAGDFRMYIGEDRNKILNIVEPNFEKFGEIYLPLIEEFDYVELKQPGGTEVIQDCSRQAVYHHLELLPKRVQWNIRTIRNRDGKSRDLEEALFYAEIQK